MSCQILVEHTPLKLAHFLSLIPALKVQAECCATTCCLDQAGIKAATMLNCKPLLQDTFNTLYCVDETRTHQHHWRSLRHHEGQHHVAHLSLPQGIHSCITCLPLVPTVPAEVVIRPIPVLLTICVIVLAIVGHQVIQGEAIMGNNEVDALVWFPACNIAVLFP